LPDPLTNHFGQLTAWLRGDPWARMDSARAREAAASAKSREAREAAFMLSTAGNAISHDPAAEGSDKTIAALRRRLCSLCLQPRAHAGRIAKPVRLFGDATHVIHNITRAIVAIDEPMLAH